MRFLLLTALISLGVIGATGNSVIYGSTSSTVFKTSDEIAPGDYYTVKEGRNVRMKFNKRIKARVHTSRNFAPYATTYGHSKNDILVKPGQWVELYIQVNGRWTWALATDADLR